MPWASAATSLDHLQVDGWNGRLLMDHLLDL
jgi:hypothetical protein